MEKTKFQWVCLIIGVTTGTVVLGGVALFLCFMYMFFTSTGDYKNLDPANTPAMIETTIEWGRFAPFPDDIEHFTIKAGGSMFTGSYRGSFKARDSKTIKNWIKNSPGIMEPSERKEMDGGGIKYIISPGGGAQYGEVIVNDNETSVDFYVCWS